MISNNACRCEGINWKASNLQGKKRVFQTLLEDNCRSAM